MVGVLGGPLTPLGGPPAAVSLLLLAALPLAGLSAYLATRELRVGRVLRALAGAVYALLGVTGGAVAQGRLDGVVTVVLLPLVLAGVLAVLRGVRVSGRRGSWWSTAAGTALALAVVGAFAPLVYALVLVVVVVGFVLVPSPPRAAGRRAMALAVIVVLPVLLLLPWPTVLLTAPEILLHGTGAPVAERFAGALDILSLDPGGPGTVPWAGLLLVLVAVGGALLAPRRAAVPGLALLLLGVGAAALVGSFALPPLSGGDARPGWTGPALALAACGALWSLLAQVAAARAEPLGQLLGRRERSGRAPDRRGESELDLGGAGFGGRLSDAAERVGASATGLASRFRARERGDDRSERVRGVAVPVLALAVVALAVVTVLGGGAGPLAATRPATLAAPLADELARSGAGVVVLTRDADTTRRSGPALPRYGDDDFAPVGAAPARLQRDVRALLSGDPATVQAGVAELATAGTGVVVLPDEQTARSVRASAGPLLADAPPASDGRPVARVALPVGRRGAARAAGLGRRHRGPRGPAASRRPHAGAVGPADRRRARLAGRRPPAARGGRRAGVGVDRDGRRRAGGRRPRLGPPRRRARRGRRRPRGRRARRHRPAAAPAPAAGARAVHGALGPAVADSPGLAVSGVTPRVTSVFDHLGFPSGDVETSVAFYTAAFAPLGMAVAVRIPTGPPGAPEVVGLSTGGGHAGFWLAPGGAVEQELHVAFAAPDRAAVDAVHEAAVAHGAEVLHAPRNLPRVPPGLLRRLPARPRRPQRRSRPSQLLAGYSSPAMVSGSTPR